METISKLLEGRETSQRNTSPEELTADDICYTEFAPVVSVDAERSFSTYKTIVLRTTKDLWPLNTYQKEKIIIFQSSKTGKF